MNVFRQRENPILRNIPCAQYEESKSMSLTTFGYFLISALAEALAMDQVITAPRLLISSMYFWTIESNCPKSKDGPVFERYLSIDVCGCLVWKFCRATCKPNQKKKKEYIHIEDFFSLFPEVAFHTFFGTPVQYFLRCLGISSKNFRRPRYFHARRYIFQWNTGSRRSI